MLTCNTRTRKRRQTRARAVNPGGQAGPPPSLWAPQHPGPGCSHSLKPNTRQVPPTPSPGDADKTHILSGAEGEDGREDRAGRPTTTLCRSPHSVHFSFPSFFSFALGRFGKGSLLAARTCWGTQSQRAACHFRKRNAAARASAGIWVRHVGHRPCRGNTRRSG